MAAWFLPAFCLPSMLEAQNAGSDDRKQAFAVRVPEGSIRVDGHLADPAWVEATPIVDFVQKEPNEGAKPTEKMEIRFVYDAGSFYVGARMYKEPGSLIQAPMGRRDRVEQSEHVLVALDTFLDRRTAYVFGVTASGVRLDRFHPQDEETTFDEGFDPVWQARTQVDEQGWTAELWIPFSQLRFNPGDEQVWGLNVRRFTPTLNEEDYWIPVPRTVAAWASRFGRLEGLEGLTSKPAGGGFALCGRLLHPYGQQRSAQSFRSRRESREPGGTGSENRSRIELDPGCHVQSGLRAGRGRSGGGESFCQRDDIPRETALFHRGCTSDELHRCHELLFTPAASALRPRDRPAATTWTIRGRPPSWRRENSRGGSPRELLWGCWRR